MKRIGVYMILAAGAVVTAYPFVWMVCTGFKSFPEAMKRSLVLFPEQWRWGNYAETWSSAHFGIYFYNSFFVSCSVTIAVVLTSLMAGYAFARLQFPGRSLLFGLVLATMMVPFEVTLIPNYILILKFGWYNTYKALIVPWSVSAFSIFLIRQAMLGLPRDYFDAARIDGCGHIRFLVWVGAPLVKPMMVTVGLFAFLGTYNSLVWPLIVTSDEAMRVVQYGLTVFSGAEGAQINLLMCASTIVMIPTVGIYFVAQKHFFAHSLATGLKG